MSNTAIPILTWDDFLTKKTGLFFWKESYRQKRERWEAVARAEHLLSSPFCLKSYLTQEVTYYHQEQRWWGPINFFIKLWAWCFHEINHKEIMLDTYLLTHAPLRDARISVAGVGTMSDTPNALVASPDIVLNDNLEANSGVGVSISQRMPVIEANYMKFPPPEEGAMVVLDGFEGGMLYMGREWPPDFLSLQQVMQTMEARLSHFEGSAKEAGREINAHVRG